MSGIKKFIVTTDRGTSEMLARNGFRLVQEKDGKWTFLNDATITVNFGNFGKIQCTDILTI